MPLNWEGFLKKVAQAAARQLKIKKPMDVSLAFVSRAAIRKLNKSYRGQDRVTDVLSFPEVNEILICYGQAIKQAKKFKHSIKKEVATLFIHGFLHLLGFDDKIQKQTQKMNQITRRFLS